MMGAAAPRKKEVKRFTVADLDDDSGVLVDVATGRVARDG